MNASFPPPSDDALGRSIPTPAGAPSLVVEDVEWQRMFRSPGFLPGVAAFVAIVVLFWSLVTQLPRLYFDGDGYYSHGLITPFLAGYIIYRKWDRIKTIPVKGSWWAVVPLAVLLFLVRMSSIAGLQAIMSVGVVGVLFLSVWLLAGMRWAVAVLPALLYLLFGLPVWSMAIDVTTNPLQLLSTDVAFAMLQLTGFKPYAEGTSIVLNTYSLDVGVPCSGLKLVVALSAFTFFFMMIGGLKWWGNIVLLVLLLPLALFVNGLRIAMIGIVGELNGAEAAATFHDWSGYLALGVCFFILMKIWRVLGWQN